MDNNIIHRQRNSAALVNKKLDIMYHFLFFVLFLTKAFRIQGAVLEVSKELI